MLNFFKVFLRGMICTILLPLILVVWVLYGVYCFVTFIVMFIKSVILFFMGDSINDELPEDNEAKRIILENEKEQANQQQMMTMMYQNTMAQMQQFQQNGYPQQNINNFQQQSSENVEQPQQPGMISTDNENNEGGNNND